MALSRRQFLKWAGVTGIGAVVFNGCRVPDHEIQVQSPVEMPEDLVTGRDNYYATAAQLGMASEGLLVRVMEGRAKKIEGNPDHPVNTGKHGIRAEALLQALYHPDRIKYPLAPHRQGRAVPSYRVGRRHPGAHNHTQRPRRGKRCCSRLHCYAGVQRTWCRRLPRRPASGSRVSMRSAVRVSFERRFANSTARTRNPISISPTRATY